MYTGTVLTVPPQLSCRGSPTVSWSVDVFQENFPLDLSRGDTDRTVPSKWVRYPFTTPTRTETRSGPLMSLDSLVTRVGVPSSTRSTLLTCTCGLVRLYVFRYYFPPRITSSDFNSPCYTRYEVSPWDPPFGLYKGKPYFCPYTRPTRLSKVGRGPSVQWKWVDRK